jgi:POT family proton-dependent oligopeptide transporter
MVGGYGFGALGELLTSGLGLAFIARYVPAQMGGFMMGAYYVASGVAQYLGGMVATIASVPSTITDPVQMMPIYTRLFNALGWAGVACTIFALVVAYVLWLLDRKGILRFGAGQHESIPDAGKGMPTAGSEQ